VCKVSVFIAALSVLDLTGFKSYVCLSKLIGLNQRYLDLILVNIPSVQSIYRPGEESRLFFNRALVFACNQ